MDAGEDLGGEFGVDEGVVSFLIAVSGRIEKAGAAHLLARRGSPSLWHTTGSALLDSGLCESRQNLEPTGYSASLMVLISALENAAGNVLAFGTSSA
jgi:hypothetical protein